MVAWNAEEGTAPDRRAPQPPAAAMHAAVSRGHDATTVTDTPQEPQQHPMPCAAGVAEGLRTPEVPARSPW